MAPQRVFQTEQERRAARNASSRQSYQKYRHVINQRRREKHQAAKNTNNRVEGHLEPLIQPAARQTDIEVDSGEALVQHRSDLAEALDQTERLRQRFDILTDNDPRCFVDKIYHAYIQDTIGHTQLRGRRRVIENALTRLFHFGKLGHKYEHVVLNSAGADDMEWVQCVLGPIHQLIFWLEDLLCETWNSLEDLQARYTNKEISFCSDDD
ncbi:hypothetical protein IW262DRAFT_400731 [Armillaria fumosa]|nr:hypothetical protein IW262DRAFT_400731 [Armillaria fumosa]